jgi:hypothetical protein
LIPLIALQSGHLSLWVNAATRAYLPQNLEFQGETTFIQRADTCQTLESSIQCFVRLLMVEIRIGHCLVDLEKRQCSRSALCTHSGVTCMTQPEQARIPPVTHVPATNTFALGCLNPIELDDSSHRLRRKAPSHEKLAESPRSCTNTKPLEQITVIHPYNPQIASGGGSC